MMASPKKPPSQLPPMDFFPFRGQYGGSSLGATLFVAVRAAVPILLYALLAPPTSPFSLFSHPSPPSTTLS
jgi:hypothetical protein